MPFVAVVDGAPAGPFAIGHTMFNSMAIGGSATSAGLFPDDFDAVGERLERPSVHGSTRPYVCGLCPRRAQECSRGPLDFHRKGL